MANPFEQIRANSNNQKKSFDWYMRQVRSVARNITSATSAFRSDLGSFESQYDVGSMYLFVYDAKTYGTTLPYFDRFPLCLPFEDAPGGFWGLNLHYIPFGLRAELLGKLMETAKDKTLDEKSTMRYNWDLLKSASRFPGVRPCVKRYLGSHMRSGFFKVNPQDWKAAIFLPVESFQGASRQKVYADSRAMM